jgi:hypothetical protein
VYIRWAQPIAVEEYRSAYEANPLEAENKLMAEIERLLHETVLEAPRLQQLEDAHRLAHQRGRPGFAAVQKALDEVLHGEAEPEDMHKIVCRKGRESILYQLLGWVLLGIAALAGWPFRVFGRLCAMNSSEEMTFRFLLWALVLAVGLAAGDYHWVGVVAAGTYITNSSWLWAWRRGILDE